MSDTIIHVRQGHVSDGDLLESLELRCVHEEEESPRVKDVSTSDEPPFFEVRLPTTDGSVSIYGDPEDLAELGSQLQNIQDE